MLIEENQSTLSLDTWKSVEGAVITKTPGAPVRLAPVILKVCDVEFVSTVTLPKSATVPAVIEGDGGPPEQINTGVAEFLGAGATKSLSAALLSVSVQPLFFLTVAVVFVNAAVTVPSAQLDVPYPTRSITFAVGQPVNAVIPLTKATFPFVPDIAIFGLAVASGVGSAAPTVPAADICTR